MPENVIMRTFITIEDYLDNRNMSTMIHTASKAKAALRVACLVICILSQAAFSTETNALTFFGWSDQHVQTDGYGRHLIPAIDAMNKLPQTPYPENIGGKVAEPNFVIGLGDITEWPTRAALDTYEKLITERLKYPSYDVAGNHDSGGLTPSDTVHNWLIKRHGALSYTFDKKGVHFIALYSKYDESLNNPAQPISEDALEYLRTNLSKVPDGTPIVVATHLCFESITNKDEFVDAFGNSNVILVLGGHYHKASVNKYRGINFVQLPSPAPNSPSEITAIRIDSERLVAIPFDYEKGKWCTDSKKILDTKIQGPRRISVGSQSARKHDASCIDRISICRSDTAGSDKSRSVFFGSLVFDVHRAILKGIPFQHDSLSLRAYTNTYILVFTRRIFKSCAVNGDVTDFPLNIYTDPLLFRTIITNDTVFDLVSAAAAKFVCLLTKQYPDLAVALDRALPNNVVSVTVPDTDSIRTVLRQDTILRKPVRNTPTKVNSFTIARRQAIFENGPLGAASGVESQVGVVYRFAV
jgi:predicted phosphodiesterase